MSTSAEYLEKYKDNGLTGLANLGNTCYINSTMQILSHCYKFNEFIDNINIENLNKVPDTILFTEWRDLKNMMWSKNCTIAPNRFVNCVHKISVSKNIELFSGFAQNDLPEFLMFIFDCFHNSLKRKVMMNIQGSPKNITDNLAKECFTMMKNTHADTYSEILTMFYGVHVSQLHSVVDNKCLSNKPESYCNINLPLPNTNTNTCTIYECFDLYTSRELLDGDNAWYDENDKTKKNVYKSIAFWSFPEILIVDFKRFTNFNKKINSIVSTPLTNLDLSKYVIGYDKHSYIYELFGICNHSGGCMGGHYTSYVKNANGKWYHFNDTNIVEISQDKLITNKGYCYFYKKIM